MTTPSLYAPMPGTTATKHQTMAQEQRGEENTKELCYCLRFTPEHPNMTAEEYRAGDVRNARVINRRKLLIIPILLVVYLILRFGFGLQRED